MSDTALLQIQDLQKYYDDSSSNTLVLNHINLSVNKNEFLCILGPSGCGKTTLLRCIAGFEKYSGNIKINGITTTKPNTDRILVFQDFNQLLPWKTVLQNITFPLKKFGVTNPEECRQIACTYLDKVGLSDYKDFYPHQLSGGMKQRVAIAKALALKPNLILMDEPFASLDAMTRRKLQNELLTLSKSEDVTIIFITHNIQEAIVLGTRIMVMSKKGNFKLDVNNTLVPPITPASEGYAKMWNLFNNSINEENLN